jgi:hypothetical protein
MMLAAILVASVPAIVQAIVYERSVQNITQTIKKRSGPSVQTESEDPQDSMSIPIARLTGTASSIPSLTKTPLT